MEVKIYTTPSCGYCHQAKRYLSQCGVAYQEYDVAQDPAAAEEMVRLTGQIGVPVILVNGEVVIGFNRSRLEQLLGNADDLESFLKKLTAGSRVVMVFLRGRQTLRSEISV